MFEIREKFLLVYEAVQNPSPAAWAQFEFVQTINAKQMQNEEKLRETESRDIIFRIVVPDVDKGSMFWKTCCLLNETM